MAHSQGYIDLHLHALPGVDDGVRSVHDGLAMVEGLSDLGFSELVTTPHRDFQRWRYTDEALLSSYQSMREAIEKKELPVRLGLGAEYTYGSQLHDEIQAGEARTIDGGCYVLLELPERHLPHTIPTALFQIGLKGYYPILAHPERCRPFQDDVDALAKLAAGRALVQVSFRSLAGTFGRTIKKTAWRLVEDELADVVATDCHSPKELKKVVAPVLKALNKRLPAHRVDYLLKEFPRTLLPKGAG